MKIYEITDAELQLSIGVLLYYENADAFVVELSRTLTEWDAPLLFAGFVKRGIYTIPRAESRMWVRERVIPAGRQNIGGILKTHHMEKYEEIRFLETSHGKCSQDSMYLRKVDVLPEYVLLRHGRNLIDVTPLCGTRLLCIFADRRVKIVSLIDLADERGVSKILSNPDLFASAMVSPGGYAVTFNDSIDIPAASLDLAGTELPLGADDLKCFAEKNVLSPAETCEVLGCSRQNVAYLSKTGQLKPLKKKDGGNLYLKGDVVRMKW